MNFIMGVCVMGLLSIGQAQTSTILSTQVLCKEPGRYIGWPSIAMAPNGDLLAVFSGDRTAHISPDGKVQMVRSTDGGKTWGAPVVVHDTPIDDRDAGIVCTAKGTMLVSWFTNAGGGEWQGHWVVRSTDNGQTWGEPIRTEVTTPHGPTQLKDGRLLFMGQRPHESHGKPYDIGVQESRDDGLTWQTLGAFPAPAGEPLLSYDEVHIGECASGKLIAMFRDCSEPHFLRQSESLDGGKTWAAPHVTNVQGLPPHVIRLHNNWLLVTYAKRWAPRGEFACISRDNGLTWDAEHEIQLTPALSGDIGYPATVELPDHTLFSVFYQAEKAGETPSLMAVHWKYDFPGVNHYEETICGFEQKDREEPPAPGGIVFTGSSTIRMWDIKKWFPELPAINRGFGGSQFSDVLYYAPRLVAPYKPRVVVLYTGDNDIAHGKSPEQVSADFDAVIAAIRHDAPNAQVLIILIKPCPARWANYDKAQQVNRHMLDVAKGDAHLKCVDLGTALMDGENKPRPELFIKDGLHLNDDGYRIWTDLLRPVIDDAMKAPQ